MAQQWSNIPLIPWLGTAGALAALAWQAGPGVAWWAAAILLLAAGCWLCYRVILAIIQRLFPA
jgi:hypothetical protein